MGSHNSHLLSDPLSRGSNRSIDIRSEVCHPGPYMIVSPSRDTDDDDDDDEDDDDDDDEPPASSLLPPKLASYGS